jgi:hypothetical protein
MTRLIGRAWVPIGVVTVGASTVSRLRGVFGPYVSVHSPAAGWLPELCAVGHSQRATPGAGALLIG